MANANWASGGKIYSMHVMPVIITATATIGAAGAVTSFVGSAVQSVTRVSKGRYRVKCRKGMSFNGLLFAAATPIRPSGADSDVVTAEVQNDPNTSLALASGAEIDFYTLDATGAVVDPASGSKLTMIAIVSNSSIKIGGE